MAEFCLECYLKDFPEDAGIMEMIVVGNNLDLCEGCGEMKKTVVEVKKP